jgi:hypothetical protein
VALAKAAPGKLSYGSVSIGSASHLTMEMLKTAGEDRRRPYPLQGRAAGDRRPARRPDPGGILRSRERAPVHEGRPLPRDRRDRAASASRPSRTSRR